MAMCVNDILVQGAEPLFFLDYLAVGKVSPERVAEIVSGVAQGCELAGCALVGGETAEMPGFYGEEEYDIAGFAVGVANRSELIDGSGIQAGDVLLALPSSGVHSNGFSLVRKVFEGYSWDTKFPELESPLGTTLLEPTRIYVKSVLPLLKEKTILGMAHITGGGLTENIPRVLPEGLGVEIDRKSWEVPPIFRLIERLGEVETTEMYRTFNMGVGFVMIVRPENAEKIQEKLAASGENPFVIGKVVPGSGVSYR